MKKSWLLSLSLALCFGCTPAPGDGSGGSGGGATGGKGGSTGGRGGSGGSTGGTTGGSDGSGGSTGGTTGGSGGSTGGTGGSTGGTTGGTGGSTGGSGGSAGGTGGSSPDGGKPEAAPAEAGGGGTPGAIAGELDGAAVEMKCMSNRSNGFCVPFSNGMINVPVKFGGEAGKMYDVTLKVWAIAEGIAYTGGMPVGDHVYIGGRGNTARYSPCGLEIAGGTTYFFNRHTQPGGDRVHKFEYTTPALKIPGGAAITLFCRDTNNHICMNNPPPFGRAANGGHTFMNPPPRLAAKLGMQPIEGLIMYLEVMSATAAN